MYFQSLDPAEGLIAEKAENGALEERKESDPAKAASQQPSQSEAAKP